MMCLTFLNWPLVTSQAELQATPSAGLRRAEAVQVTPRQLSLQLFHLVVNLWSKLTLKERATDKVKHEPEQKQGGEGAE